MTRFCLAMLTCFIAGCSRNVDAPVAEIAFPSTRSQRAAADRSEAARDRPFPRKLAAEHLPNAVQVHARVISGGLPEGDEGFQELQELGVKTIISVDGMKPDVETASRYGLKYVHLPHGYDGIPASRVRELAKAVRDLEGPIYVHCHHGKHRSAAAAGTACVAAGFIERSDALRVLDLAGTSPHYRGLFQSVEESVPLDEALLDELKVEFREAVPIPPMAEAMVAIGHTSDHLKAIAAAGWRTPADHPDLEPAHEALLLRERFTELLRTDGAKGRGEEFRQLLRNSEAAARELEHQLRTWRGASDDSVPPEAFRQLADRITANCKTCHQTYRDVPLGEKQQTK